MNFTRMRLISYATHINVEASPDFNAIYDHEVKQFVVHNVKLWFSQIAAWCSLVPNMLSHGG